MTWRLVITAKAQIEIQSAYDYYEEQQAGLGDRFLNVLAPLFRFGTTSALLQLHIKCYERKYSGRDASSISLCPVF